MPGSIGRGLRAASLAVCLMLLAACADSKSSARVWLDVPFLSQETLLCAPTSAAMVLAYYGDAQSPRKLKALASGRVYDPREPFTDFSITPFARLIGGLRLLGYNWRETTLPTTAQGFDHGLDVIKADVRAGYPVLVDITHDGVGHTLVVVGFDDATQRIEFLDPATSPPGRNSATYVQLEAVWNEMAYGGNFRAMIRTQRRGVAAGGEA